MKKSELVDQLTAELKHSLLTTDDVQYGVDIILDALANALSQGKRVEVRGFGSFKLNHRDARIGRNPKTGSIVQVPEKYSPNFRPAQELRQRVDNLS